MTKMTKRDMYEQIKAHLTDEAEIAFINHEIDLLNKKNASRSDKPTKAQIDRQALIEKVYAVMEPNVSYRVSDIAGLIPELNGATNQKLTHMLTKMRENVLVSREVVKGVAYFSKI